MSDHHTVEIGELDDAAVRTDTAGYDARKTPGDQNDAVALCMDQVIRVLEEASKELRPTSRRTIFRIPRSLREVNRNAVEPEVVSIGPYHHGRPQVLAFEKLKPRFLESFLSRTHTRTGVDLKLLTREVALREEYARSLYSEPVGMTSADFVQMMLLDGCFVVELLHICERGREFNEYEEDLVFALPDMIPILIRDLLKLENQIPYSLLQLLFNLSGSENIDSLAKLALTLFDQACPESEKRLKSGLEFEHLLDLFYSSLDPTSEFYPTVPNHTKSAQSVQCVTELRPSGIKFKSIKAFSFLGIRFSKPALRKPYVLIEYFMARVLKNPVLQIPDIAINDFMTTVLINCVSLEQCRKSRSKYMTDYVYFMHCLIKQPKDVSFLRSDGIISPFSHDDRSVAELFDKLGNSISFNVRGCFLSGLFWELDMHYRSNWANMMRTYFSSPWSSISAITAFLLIVFTITQTVLAILTYRFPR